MESTMNLTTERLQTDEPGIARAAALLRAGHTVAFPTETVYGLGANALNPAAIQKIFAAKQRPAWDPLIVHVDSRAMLSHIVTLSRELEHLAEVLIEAFWPGPLTLLLPRTPAVPDSVTAGRPLVGVRMPAHAAARELIRLAALPIAAPSANRFGGPSPTTAAHVLADLDGRIAAVLDGGPTLVGVESTVFDVAARAIYRPGAITPQMLSNLIGEAVHIATAAPQHAVQTVPEIGRDLRPGTNSPKPNWALEGAEKLASEIGRDFSPGINGIEQMRALAPGTRSLNEPAEKIDFSDPSAQHTLQAEPNPAALASPGMGIRHYAPRARLILVADQRQLLDQIALHPPAEVGVMLPDGWNSGPAKFPFAWGAWPGASPEASPDATTLAHRLYSGLRTLDQHGVKVIVCPLPPMQGLGEALRDRLEKAARLK
jgi:tRNA threonylcarbamoyl adenosine modification protein (Sua5/YciO/YrdC/YwlC family)